VSESKLERECRDYIEHAHKGKLVKAKIVGQNGWPDRMLCVPRCPIIFIEFKAPGKPNKYQPGQKRWRDWLLNAGFIFWVIDEWDDFLTKVEILTSARPSHVEFR
jgi:hypothetical protein